MINENRPVGFVFYLNCMHFKNVGPYIISQNILIQACLDTAYVLNLIRVHAHDTVWFWE